MVRPPVVLLHGWGGSFASTFERNGWVDALERSGRCVVRIDLPGHGADGASCDALAYGDLAGDVRARLPAGPIDLVGYSLGAKIALELASCEVIRFPRIVLLGIGDNIFAPERNGEVVAAALCEGLCAGSAAPVRALVEYSRGSGADPRALAAVLRRVPNPVATSARLSRIRSSVLVVNGALDALAQPDAELLAALDRPGHVLLDDVDHFLLPANNAARGSALAFLQVGQHKFAEDDIKFASSL